MAVNNKTWDVEFWPGTVITVQAFDENEALHRAILSYGGWPGGCESSGNGLVFRAWVREKK